MTRRKTLAILFAILFLVYYQEWIVVLMLDLVSGLATYVVGKTSDKSNVLATTNLNLLADKSNANKIDIVHQRQPQLSSAALPSSIATKVKANNSVQKGATGIEEKNVKAKSAKDLGRKDPVGKKKPPDIPRKRNRVQELSMEIQSQLAQLQYFGKQETPEQLLNSFCNRPRMICGPPIDCELGCQIHHFITCLIIGYTTNRTLIPDFTKWSYSKSWTSTFQSILGHNDLLLHANSTLPNCAPSENINNNFVNINNEISRVSWTKDKVELSTRDILEYPFLNGVLPVPYEIGMKLKQSGIPSPFQWWIGQFGKFIMRLEPQAEQNLVKIRKQFYNLQRSNKIPIAGIMIRRRDKLGEKKKTSNSLDKYMTPVKKYFSKYENSPTTPANLTKRVYFATDDGSLLLLARKQYPKPKWDIVNFQNSKFDIENLVRDIFLLRECDLVVCSFASDVCRLVSEILETKSAGASSRVKSLDHKYFFDVPDFKGKNKLRIILQ